MAKTIGEMLFLYTAIYLLACVLIAVVVMLLSMVLENGVAVMGVLFAFLLSDLLTGPPKSLRILSQIKGLTPVGVLKNSFVPEFRLIGAAGVYLTAYHAAILLYMGLSVVLAVVMGKVYVRRARGL